MSILNRSRKPAHETTLESQVEILGDFRRVMIGDGRAGRHNGLLLKTDSGPVIIHLGPLSYFMKNNFQIKAGDTLSVIGIRVEREQVPLFQAREVRNHRQRLRLRDLNGLPLW